MSSKTLKPDVYRDFISIASFISYLAIFLSFTLNQDWLSNLVIPVFLVVGGMGLMVVGKIFKVRKWMKDGIQETDVTKIFVIVLGALSFIIGALLMIGVELSKGLLGIGGVVALASGMYVLIDYIVKNTGIKK